MLPLSKIEPFLTRLLPLAMLISVLCIAYGLYSALVVSPPDYQQGEAVRIMYVHVPCAWMALGLYGALAVCSAVYLVWRLPFIEVLALAIAPTGACFALLTLITGALWGKPIWGTWWVWDARLTSMLILFLQYVAYLLLARAKLGLEQKGSEKGAIMLASFALLGAINLPIVKFSVDFWHSLHQPASVFRMAGPSLDISMLKPLILMALGCVAYALTIIALRVKTELLKRKLLRKQFNLGQNHT